MNLIRPTMASISGLSRFLAVALLFVATSTFAAPTIHRFNGDGDTAYLEFDGLSFMGSVFVTQNGNANQVQSYIQYAVFDTLGNLIQVGDGVIPNTAFSVIGKVARLNVDTSAIPGFNLYTGGGGLLDLTWTQSSDWSTRSSGASKTQFGNIITRWSGSDYVFSAKATGTLFGITLTDVGLCKIGKNQGKGFEVEYP